MTSHFVEMLIALFAVALLCILIGSEVTLGIALGIFAGVAFVAIVSMLWEFMRYLDEKRKGPR